MARIPTSPAGLAGRCLGALARGEGSAVVLAPDDLHRPLRRALRGAGVACACPRWVVGRSGRLGVADGVALALRPTPAVPVALDPRACRPLGLPTSAPADPLLDAYAGWALLVAVLLRGGRVRAVRLPKVHAPPGSPLAPAGRAWLVDTVLRWARGGTGEGALLQALAGTLGPEGVAP